MPQDPALLFVVFLGDSVEIFFIDKTFVETGLAEK
jgi:hypothetical protein